MRLVGALTTVGLAVIALLTLDAGSAPVQAPLPRAGLAVQTSRGVDLVGLDGRRRRFLPGFRLRWIGVERYGQVELRDPAGHGYELRAGVLAPAPADTVTLASGFTLRFRGRWFLARGGKLIERFPAGTHVELDDSGAVLTSLRSDVDGAPLGAPVALDLRTGERQTLTSGCRVGAQRGRVRFELCGAPYDRGQPTAIVRVEGERRRTLVGPAERRGRGPAGWWRSVILSPNARYLLAQWLGECEVPTAFLIDVQHPRLTALGRDRAGQIIESRTIGWNGARALVALPRSPCGFSAAALGVYGFDAGLHERRIYPLSDYRQTDVRLWR